MIAFIEPFLPQKSSEEGGEEDVEGQKKGKVIKFGWIEGVYVSILLSLGPLSLRDIMI